MIGALAGRLAEKRPEELIVDVNGVGYEVRIPLSTFLELPEPGGEVRLHVHTHVREDVFQLYGFLTDFERTVFRLCIRINGVGPRLALAILSGLPVPRFVQAIRDGDLAALCGIPGVGTKTAERILVDLRDRVKDLVDGEIERGPSEGVEGATVSALMNLGYPRGQAEKAVRAALDGASEPPPLEVLIREALRVAAG